MEMMLLMLTFASFLRTITAKQNVLVLGGNGFIGSETVVALLGTGNYDVTILNRGSEHYDSARRVVPHVTQLVCDRYASGRNSPRENPLLGCADFAAALRLVEPFWDFVIDFSGYDPQAVVMALDAVGNKVRHYIFISSDSVYEVCGAGTAVLSDESAARRPKDPTIRAEMAGRDPYGDRKLACEELLNSRSVPFVVLRLPDVIGPRDTTHRWWTYQLWIQYLHVFNRPIPIPPSVKHLRTSYVYVSDVARAVLSVMERIDDPRVLRQTFNLAMERDLTLEQLLKAIAAQLGVNRSVTVDTEDEEAPRFFPSVYRGPVNWRRAREVLDFQPTPWPKILQETVDFYKQALVKFERERKKVFSTLSSILGGDSETKRRLMQEIEQDLLNATFGEKDEL